MAAKRCIRGQSRSCVNISSTLREIAEQYANIRVHLWTINSIGWLLALAFITIK